MLKMSEAVSLALRAMSLLARQPDRRVSTIEFAEKLQASRDHLAKVLNRLVRSGLLVSSRGPGGGFLLASVPDEIRLVDIYEAIEGEMTAKPCVFATERSCAEECCILGDLPSRVNQQVLDYFRDNTLGTVGRRLAGPTGEGCKPR